MPISFPTMQEATDAGICQQDYVNAEHDGYYCEMSTIDEYGVRHRCEIRGVRYWKMKDSLRRAQGANHARYICDVHYELLGGPVTNTKRRRLPP